MYAQYDRKSEHSQKLRKRGGAWLKQQREAAQLTQRELAEKVGLAYYTFIAQVEGGTGRVPPDLYEAYADALGIPLREFVQKILEFYDPFTYRALFGVKSGDNRPLALARQNRREPVKRREK